jgi:sugar phosphate isomerase/epimerase
MGVGTDSAEEIRRKVEFYSMYFEGIVNLPKDTNDLQRFEKEIGDCNTAGAHVVRTAALGGRRYETFETAEAFRDFKSRAIRSITLAEPILKRHRIKLAIENHKDWRIPEMLDLLKRFDSEHIGVCVDTGNSIALLEDPITVIKAYAPFAFSVHLKDMAVQPYAEGFLLSEVPLGEGLLDIREIVSGLLKANPNIHFSLEMITRDPLKVPCLAPKYWATMEGGLASELATTLALVNTKQSPSLPTVTGLSITKQLELENEHVRRCFAFADSG